MYIVEIIPIKRGIPFDMLSYYSKDACPVGAIVEAPFKKGSMYGVVLACKSLVEMRAEVRGATFNFKKLQRIVSTDSAFSSIGQAIIQTSDMLCVPRGAIARICIPEVLIQHIEVAEFCTPPAADAIEHTFTPELQIDTLDARTALHKRTIRQYIGKNQSVVLVAPTITEVEAWEKLLATGIEHHIAALHSKKNKKETSAFYAKLTDTARPKVFIVTPGFACLPRQDIGCIILESEQSPFYMTHDRFSVDMKIPIELYAKIKGIHLIWATAFPSFEVLAKMQTSIPRHLIPENIQIVPIEKQTGTLPQEVLDLIKYGMRNKKKIFIYTNQKGFAPISMCRDCKSILECTYCKLPLKLGYVDKSDRASGRIYQCTNCERTYPTETNCALCHSWNISPFSIGTDAIYTEVLEHVPKDHVYVVDGTHSPDEKTIHQYIQDSSAQEYSIYIGTKKLIPYLGDFDYCVIPFFDRLIQIPSFRTVEDMLDIVFTMSRAAKESLLLCTRNSELALVEQLQNKKITQLIQDELTLREKLEYPPFAVLHKITISTFKNKQEKIEQSLVDFFAHLEIKANVQAKKEYSDFGQKISIQCVLKSTDAQIETHAEEIKDFLLSISPSYHIERNPARML